MRIQCNNTHEVLISPCQTPTGWPHVWKQVVLFVRHRSATSMNPYHAFPVFADSVPTLVQTLKPCSSSAVVTGDGGCPSSCSLLEPRLLLVVFPRGPRPLLPCPGWATSLLWFWWLRRVLRSRLGYGEAPGGSWLRVWAVL